MKKALGEYLVKDVVGYEGVYAVTSCGKIYSHSRIDSRGILRKGRWKGTFINNSGYERVELSLNGSNKKFYVHRIVAEAFLPNLNHLPDVNHKNEIKTDNSVDNLEWCSKQYNQEYTLAKSYSLISPDGDIIQVYNLAKFCRDNGLDGGNMNKVVLGKAKSHKGWRLNGNNT